MDRMDALYTFVATFRISSGLYLFCLLSSCWRVVINQCLFAGCGVTRGSHVLYRNFGVPRVTSHSVGRHWFVLYKGMDGPDWPVGWTF